MIEKILIVEDEFIVANALRLLLEKAGYIVCDIASSFEEAMEIIGHQHPGMVLLDIQLEGKLTGIDLANRLRTMDIAFIYLSANSNKEVFELAKATNPYGFLVKPFREKDVLAALDIALYLHENSLESKIRREPSLKNHLKTYHPKSYTKDSKNLTAAAPADIGYEGMIGESEAFLETMGYLKMVAPLETSVLILGESGTGKEKIAACIQHLSLRKNGPFIKVNCGAIPESLIESELFGHERGAFTGATERRIGKFERADGGTIFLDEIGELPLDLQAKLLRVLQEKEIERIGGNSTLKLDVRIIAATNKKLEEEVARGRFRIDLYYRLNVFPLTLPPLRERRDDIPLFVEHFIRQFSQKTGKNIKGLSKNAFENVIRYSWPGNIRELEHLIERSVLLEKSDIIEEVLLPSQNQSDIFYSNVGDTEIKSNDENEREHILKILRQCKGKITGEGGASELLGIPPSTLNSRIKKLGIRREYLG
jgi:DNA-binding NtrC family response regulator